MTKTHDENSRSTSTSQSEVWLTIKEAAKEVGCSRRSLYNWMQKGLVTWKRRAGTKRFILQASLWRESNIGLHDPVLRTVTCPSKPSSEKDT